MDVATVDDRRHMRRALTLAARARGRTAPNPMVGCVLVKGGQIVGEGFHRLAGLPHAEVEALTAAGNSARGATAYVTLEPCNHLGRTGPCSEALIAAGVARVVAAMADPNPSVAGHGAERLREAGIPVTIGLLGDEARELNRGFLKWIATARPIVIVKAAISLDGRIAASSGDSKWITGDRARREAHRLRDACDAILVGAGTVRADDPALTTRLPGGRGRDPLRVILDGKLSISVAAQVVRAGTLIATTHDAPRVAERLLSERGAEVVRLDGQAGRVDLGALLDELGRRNVLELLVEGGSQVHGSFLAAGLVDRAVIFIAPKIVGSAGIPLVATPGAATIAAAWNLRLSSMRRLGEDVMLTATFSGVRPVGLKSLK